MKTILNIMVVLALISTTKVFAQSNSISSGLGLFVFPAEGQDAKQQEADEVYCFSWAKQQTGFDPLNPTQVQAAQVDRSADGSAVVGAAGGAAAGAAIGAIAGDAGKGAGIGAVVGGLRGRRAKVAGDARQQQANEQAARAAEQQMRNDYNKAFSACMEAKGYTVR